MTQLFEFQFGITALLVLTRTGAMVASAPMFGSRAVAWRFRAALIVVLSLAVLPTVTGYGESVVPSARLVEAIMGELFIGMLFGLAIRLTIMSLQLAGDMISQLTGWSLGQNSSDSETGGTSPLGKLFAWTMLGTFIAFGGPNQMIGGLLETFQSLPPGTVVLSIVDSQLIAGLLQQSFELALRTAAPAVIALIVATLVLAIANRSAPAVNSFQVGFAVKSILAFTLATVVVLRGPTLVTNYLEPTLEQIATQVGDANKQASRRGSQ